MWTGRILSAIPVALMLMSAGMKLAHPPEVVQAFTQKFAYPATTLTALGIVEIVCALLYAVPRTAVLGAILVTGYLGGAVATHVRASDVFVPPLLLGIVVWIGLILREPRLRELLPLRSPHR